MNFFSALKNKLIKTSSQLGGGIKRLFGNATRLTDEQQEELETLLLQADVGMPATQYIIDTLNQNNAAESPLEEQLIHVLTDILTPHEATLPPLTAKPSVLLTIGVNGSGKTTTLGKLAAQFTAAGKRIMLVAGDTFRAGATGQLNVWAERSQATFFGPENNNTDPASLIFTALEHAQTDNTDIVMCDTAGRLQNRTDLMAELDKIHRVIKKFDENAPHATLLVIDGTAGQNALQQVEEFQKVTPISGLVVTKLDSASKAGIIIALAYKFDLPIYYIGVGERIEDLQPFHAQTFISALLTQ